MTKGRLITYKQRRDSEIVSKFKNRSYIFKSDSHLMPTYPGAVVNRETNTPNTLQILNLSKFIGTLELWRRTVIKSAIKLSSSFTSLYFTVKITE